MHMISAVSDATWTFFGVIVTSMASVLVALIAVLVRQGKMRVSVEQINRAVNHQGDDKPTLVERVIGIEERTEVLEVETVNHRKWERLAFTALARHVGCELPPHGTD